jgi:hypothetical protein
MPIVLLHMRIPIFKQSVAGDCVRLSHLHLSNQDFGKSIPGSAQPFTVCASSQVLTNSMQTSVFSPSQALAIRDPSAPSALISDPHTRSPLIRGSSSAACPGRILNDLYDRLGETLEKRANRVAHRARLGPAAITEKIRSYFGENEHRYLRLTELRSKASPFIEKDCVRLVGYALP